MPLKKLKVANLRWPGGCFADTYHWKDGIGPKDKRPTMVNSWWGGVTEDNSFGTHDFLNMCELMVQNLTWQVMWEVVRCRN